MLLICMAISIFIGSRSLPFLDVVQVLRGNIDHSLSNNIVHARISRTVFGLIAGGALGLSGALMQSITRNPIADPSILGVNTGASLFVVCGMSYLNLTMPEQYIWLAFAGGALTAIFVYIVASVGVNGITPIKLALAGAATSIALSSLVSTVWACLLLLSDSIGRLLGYPGEIEVGIVTAIIGAPWFILVIRKFKVSAL